MVKTMIRELETVERALTTATPDEAAALRARRDALLESLSRLTPEQKVLMARYPGRPKIEAYIDALKADYLPDGPAESSSWFGGLSTGAKVGFIIGVCAAGLIVIAAAVVIPLVIVRKRRQRLPQYTRRVKVDTTDDKDIDVYGSDENSDTPNE